MKRFTCKTYVVQQADRDGRLGDVLAVKFTLSAAHEIAEPSRRHPRCR